MPRGLSKCEDAPVCTNYERATGAGVFVTPLRARKALFVLSIVERSFLCSSLLFLEKGLTLQKYS